MMKHCRCGREKTEGKPYRCEVCVTFTHPAYVQNRDSKDEEEKPQK